MEIKSEDERPIIDQDAITFSLISLHEISGVIPWLRGKEVNTADNSARV
jgi:hypothetical protein